MTDKTDETTEPTRTRVAPEFAKVEVLLVRWKCTCGAPTQLSAVDREDMVQALLQGSAVHGQCSECDELLEVQTSLIEKPTPGLRERLAADRAKKALTQLKRAKGG